jgi:NTE family protein
MTGKTVSLILGSGAARGLAHMGVIECLEHHGYEIKSISGCSIGSVIGGIYSTGKLDLYRKWVCQLNKTDVLRLLDFSFDKSGLFKGERLFEHLLEMIGEHLIEELPIKFTAVATDVEREKEIWFTDGSLFNAIRGSIAVPSVFTPQKYRGMTLLDGGLLNPVPVAPTAGDNTDISIAVNLNAKPGPLPARRIQPKPTTNENGSENLIQKTFNELVDRFFPDEEEQHPGHSDIDPFNMLDLMTQSIDIMQNAIAKSKMSLYHPDILIDIPRNASGFFDFHHAERLIDIGYQLTEKALEKQLPGNH